MPDSKSGVQGKAMANVERAGVREGFPSGKIQELRRLVADNGVLWTAWFVLHYQLGFVLDALHRRMKSLELKYDLPGSNSVARNYSAWQNWNWEMAGEEWTQSAEWKQSLIDEVILSNIEPGKTVLEIGPGGGRWTEVLQQIADQLIVVDLTDKAINVCKKRFSHCNNIQFFVNDGSSLDFIPDETVDFIWSFDVFVHIGPRDIEQYVREMKRILKKGGRGMIHHAKQGGLHGGWRSTMTAKRFSAMLGEYDLTLVTQMDSWGENGQFNVLAHRDTISIFEK